MRQYFCVGTYTEPILFGTGDIFKGKGKGIYLCAFEDGEITILTTLPLRNPSFLCIDEAYHKIYAVNELKDYLGEFGGGVSEISYDNKGHMKLERSYCTGGTDPCHIAVSPERNMLAISNFASGSVTVFNLDENGAILSDRKLFLHEGSSIHPIRQQGPHAHSIIFTGNAGMLVPDLGIDKLVAYCYNEDDIRIDDANTIRLQPGSGPRYGEFSPNGNHFYLINEIGSSVTHFEWDGNHLREMDTVSTLPEECEVNNICSDLHITPNGNYLYASNRGHDSIAAFRIGEKGELYFVERIPCGGKTPRNFCIVSDGKYVLVGNQDSDNIATFAIGEDGGLKLINKTEFPTPVCIRFFQEYGHFDTV